MSIKTWTKKATEVKDYTIDLTDELGTDTISTVTWTVPTGITKDSQSETTKRATIWLSSGTAGTDYTLTATVVTAGGRTLVYSITINAD